MKIINKRKKNTLNYDNNKIQRRGNRYKEYWKEELNVDNIVDAIPLRKLPSEDKNIRM